ncbi:MAG: hypothetical protein ACWA6U_17965 [Breznakibacter sp.]
MSHILNGIVILFFILDVVNFIIDQQVRLTASNSVSVYAKASVELLAILMLLKGNQYKKELQLIALLLALPVIGFLINCLGKGTFNGIALLGVVKEGNKYLFAIILFIWIKTINVEWSKIQPKFEFVFLLSAVIVLFAFIFNLEYFYTYNQNRFGFKPPLSTQNEITFFWMIGITYFGHQYFSDKVRNKLIKFLLVLSAATLLGTKGLFLFIVLYVFFLSVVHLNLAFRQLIVVGILILLLVSFFLITTGLFSFLFKIHTDHGFLVAITSMRSIHVEHFLIPLITDWEVWNFFLGGNYDRIPLTEMDLIDVYAFFGFVGVFIYGYLLRRTIFFVDRKNKTGLFFISQYLLIGSLAGHVFASGINAIYVALLFIYLQYDELVRSNRLMTSS